MLISEVRSRGPFSGNDEFVELFNPTAVDVQLGPAWTLYGRKAAAGSSYTVRWTGATGETIPAHGHFLLGGSDYIDVSRDGSLSPITDAASLRLMHGTDVIDALCYFIDQPTHDVLLDVNQGFTCEGEPVSNSPHNDTSTPPSNDDQSLVRLDAGGVARCKDTGSNAADFAPLMPSSPSNWFGDHR